MSTETPSDSLVIVLPPDLYKEILAGISREIPSEDLKVKHIGIAYDSGSALGGLYEVIVEVVNSKGACTAIAAVLCQWIRSRNNKKVRVRHRGKTVEISGLNSEEVKKFIEDNAGERNVVEEVK